MPGTIGGSVADELPLHLPEAALCPACCCVCAWNYAKRNYPGAKMAMGFNEDNLEGQICIQVENALRRG
ncbi:MAG TPA: hypothetical protein VJ417_06545, partial [Candidatus Glassbacteria bacterium]|nr:hypothetical protein [Candidatus Glassbacteria bacterium]